MTSLLSAFLPLKLLKSLTRGEHALLCPALGGLGSVPINRVHLIGGV
jgi:hypothetical protein